MTPTGQCPDLDAMMRAIEDKHLVNSNGKVTPDTAHQIAEQLRELLLSAEELVAMPPPDYLIDGVLTRNSFGVLYGRPGSCKSFAAIDWSLCVAMGLPWAGKEVRRGPVLYVAAEGIAGLGKRVQAWKLAFGVEYVDGISFFPEAINLLDLSRRDGLVALCAEMRPELVVIDTMARSIVGGDENAAKDVGMAVEAADKIRRASDATVLFIHHTTKDGASYRGSGALEGAADTMVEVKLEDDDRVTLAFEKQKEAAKGDPIRLILGVVTLADGVSSSCVLRQEARTDKEARLSAGQDAILALLTDKYPTTGASVPTLVESSGLNRQYVYEIVNALAVRGVITNTGTKQRQHWEVP